MTIVRSRREMVNIDILALSLMCCLLASVVCLLVISEEDQIEAINPASPKPPELAASRAQTGPLRGASSSNVGPMEKTPPKPLAWGDLRVQTAHLYTTIQQAEASRKDIVAKINNSVLERDNRVIEARAMDLNNKLALVQQIEAANDEKARLEKEATDKEQAAKVAITPQAKRMLGEYKGPYVLIDCVKDGAVIYPGKERIEMQPSKQTTDKLLDQITKAGFVAFVVRPAGWFNNSYDKLRPLIYKRLDEAEKQGGKYIGRSAFPLDDADSITDYLPPEAKP